MTTKAGIRSTISNSASVPASAQEENEDVNRDRMSVPGIWIGIDLGTTNTLREQAMNFLQKARPENRKMRARAIF